MRQEVPQSYTKASLFSLGAAILFTVPLIGLLSFYLCGRSRTLMAEAQQIVAAPTYSGKHIPEGLFKLFRVANQLIPIFSLFLTVILGALFIYMFYAISQF